MSEEIELSSQSTRAKERKGIAAMEAYIRTRSWSMAAEIAGYPSGRAAKTASEWALEREFKDSPRSQEFMRRYSAKHLDLLLRSVAAKTTNPKDPEHLMAVKTAKDIIAYQAKLLGLEAPTKVSMFDPTTEQIEEYLNEKMGPRQEEEEADIFEGEYIEIEEIEEVEEVEEDES